MSETGSADFVVQAFLNSWDRHVRILDSLCSKIGEEEIGLRAAEGGNTLLGYLCHIHECRNGWLNTVSPAHAAPLGEVYMQRDGEWFPITDIAEVKRQLALSAHAVGAATRQLIEENKTQVGPYDHPVHFLQHMLWHESGHYGVMTLALRIAGKEPDDAWEEENVWGVWRKE